MRNSIPYNINFVSDLETRYFNENPFKSRGRKHHGYLNKIIVTYVNGVLTAYFINGIYQIITNS